MKRTRGFPFSAASFIVFLVALAVACGAPAPETGAQNPTGSAGPSGDSYTVRGVVEEAPEPGHAEPRFRIRHEAIPDFKGMDGEVWPGGMESMTMSFAVADGVSIEGIAVGDKVEFVLVVDWAKKPTQWITEIVELPAETELDFGPETGETH
jgi:hypothetical protein